METWRRFAEQCEDLLRQHDAAKTEGERRVLLKMAASKFNQAAALRRISR